MLIKFRPSGPLIVLLQSLWSLSLLFALVSLSQSLSAATPVTQSVPSQAPSAEEVGEIFKAYGLAVSQGTSLAEHHEAVDKVLKNYPVVQTLSVDRLSFLRSSLRVLLNHYLKWNEAGELADYNLNWDESLMAFFELEGDRPSLLAFVFDELLNDSAQVERLLSDGGPLNTLAVWPQYSRDLLSEGDPVLFNQLRQNDRPMGDSADESSLDYATIRDWTAQVSKTLRTIAAAVVGEGQKFSQGRGLSSPIVVFRPLFLERIQRLIRLNKGKFVRAFLPEAMNFSSTELQEFLKRQGLFDELEELKFEKSLFEKDRDFSSPRYFRFGSSLESIANGRLRVVEEKLAVEPSPVFSTNFFETFANESEISEEALLEAVKRSAGNILSRDVRAFMAEKPAARLRGFGDFSKLPLTETERKAIRSHFLQRIQPLFDQVSFDELPNRELVAQYPFVNPESFLGSMYFYIPNNQDPKKIVWLQRSSRLNLESGISIKLSPKDFIMKKNRAAEAYVDAHLSRLTADEVSLSLEDIVADGDWYGASGFSQAGAKQTKSGRWFDPILKRQRESPTRAFDFDAEVQPKYELAMRILSHAPGRDKDESLHVNDAYLLTWQLKALEALAFNRIFVPTYGQNWLDEKKEPPEEDLIRDTKLLEWWRRSVDAIGWPIITSLSSVDEIREWKDRVRNFLIKKEELLPGISLDAIGCFDGQYDERSKQWLGSREITAMDAHEFSQLKKPDAFKSSSFRGSLAELIVLSEACLTKLRRQASIYQQTLLSEFRLSVRRAILVDLENAVRVRMLVQDHLEGKKGEPTWHAYIQSLNERLPLAKDEKSLTNANPRILELRRKLLEEGSSTAAELQVLHKVLTLPHHRRSEDPSLEELATQVALWMDESSRQSFLNEGSFRGLIDLLTEFQNEKTNRVSFLRFNFVELDALRYITKRYGWTRPAFIDSQYGDSDSVTNWIVRHSVEAGDSVWRFKNLSLSRSLELIDLAESAARAEAYLPTLWGQDWKQHLPQAADSEGYVMPATLANTVNKEVPRVQSVLLDFQRRASGFMMFNTKQQFFEPPRELRPLFEAQSGTLKRLGAWKIPTDEKHLEHLMSLAAVDHFRLTVEPVFRASLTNLKPQERMAQERLLEEQKEDKSRIPPVLIEFWRKSQSLSHALKSAKDLGWHEGSPILHVYAAKELSNVHSSLVAMIKYTGLRPVDFFLQDFFGLKGLSQSDSVQSIFTKGSTNYLPLALQAVGFSMTSKGIQEALRIIEKENKQLLDEMRESSKNFIESGRDLLNTLETSSVFSREEYLALIQKIEEDQEFKNLLLGLMHGQTAKGFEVSEEEAHDILSVLEWQPQEIEKRGGMSKVLGQLSALRRFLSQTSILFPDYQNSLSESLLKYAVPILVDEIRQLRLDSKESNVLHGDALFVQDLIKKRLQLFDGVLDSGVQLSNLLPLLTRAQTQGVFSYQRFERQLQSLLGLYFDAQRILYGKKFDPFAFQFRITEMVGLRGGMKDAKAKAAMRRYLVLLNERKQSLLNDLFSELPDDMHDDYEVVRIRSLFTRAVEDQDIRVLDARVFGEGIKPLLELMAFHEIPFSIITRGQPGSDPRYSYSRDISDFEKQWRKKVGIEENIMGTIFWDHLIDRLAQKKSLVRVLKRRLEGLNELLRDIGINRQVASDELALLFDSMDSEGLFPADLLFEALLEVSRIRRSRVDPRLQGAGHLYSNDEFLKQDQVVSDTREIQSRLTAVLDRLPEQIEAEGRSLIVRQSPQIKNLFNALLEPWFFDGPKLLAGQVKGLSAMLPSASGTSGTRSAGPIYLLHDEMRLEATEQEERWMALVLQAVHRVVVDPQGKGLHLESRLVPYGHSELSTILKAGDAPSQFRFNQAIRNDLLSFLAGQKTEFFEPRRRKESIIAVQRHIFGSRLFAVKPRLQLADIRLDDLVDQLLSMNLKERLYAEGQTKTFIAAEARDKALRAAIQESSTEKSWLALLREPAFIEKSFKNTTITKDEWGSAAVQMQIHHIFDTATALEVVFSQIAKGAYETTPNVLNDKVFMPPLTRHFAELARLDRLLGWDLDKTAASILNRNRRELRDDYEQMKLSRETRTREDRNWLFRLGADVGHMFYSGALRMRDSAYRLVVENLGVHAATLVAGEEGFEASVRFFGQFENSSFTEERLEEDDILTAPRVVADSTELFITMMSFGAYHGVKALASPVTRRVGQGIEQLGQKEFVKQGLARVDRPMRLVSSVQRSFTKPRSFYGAMLPTDQALANSVNQFAKIKLMQPRLLEVASSSYRKDMARLMASRLQSCVAHPTVCSAFVKQWFKTYKLVMASLGARIGIDAGILAMGQLIAFKLALGSLPPDSADLMKMSFGENIKILAAFMATHGLLGRWPLLNKSFSTIIMNDIWGQMSENNATWLLNSSETFRSLMSGEWAEELFIPSWLISPDLEIRRPEFERYMKLGDFSRASDEEKEEIIERIRQDPEGQQILDDYQMAVMAKTKGISGLFLAGIITGGPRFGMVMNRRAAGRMEEQSRDVISSERLADLSMTQVLGAAYGPNPRQTWINLVEKRVAYLSELPQYQGRNRQEIHKEAVEQLKKSFWQVHMYTDPETAVAVGLSELAEKTGMSVQALAAMFRPFSKQGHEFAYRQEHGVILNRQDLKTDWKIVEEAMERGIVRAEEMAHRHLVLRLSERDPTAEVGMEKGMRLMEAVLTRLEEHQKKESSKSPYEILLETLSLMGEPNYHKTIEGQIFIYKILIPTLRERQMLVNAGKQTDVETVFGVPMNPGGQSPRLLEALERIDPSGMAKGVMTAEHSRQPAVQESVISEGRSVTRFSDLQGRILGYITIEHGRRVLILTDSQVRIEIPSEVDVSMTMAGRIILQRLGENPEILAPDQLLARDHHAAYNLSVSRFTENPIYLDQQIQVAKEQGLSPRVRIAEYWIREPKPWTEGAAAPSPKSGTHRKVSVVVSEIAEGLRFIYLPNGNTGIRYEDPQGGRFSRSFILPSGWSFVNFKDQVLTLKDRFGFLTKINFAESRVRFYEAVAGVETEILQFHLALSRKGAKEPMTFEAFQTMLKTFSGFLPTEVLMASKLRMQKPLLELKPSEREMVIKRLEFYEERHDLQVLDLSPSSADRWGLKTSRIMAAARDRQLIIRPETPTASFDAATRQTIESRPLPPNLSAEQLIDATPREQFWWIVKMPQSAAFSKLQATMGSRDIPSDFVAAQVSRARGISDLSPTEKTEVTWRYLVSQATSRQLKEALTTEEISHAYRRGEAIRYYEQVAERVSQGQIARRLDSVRSELGVTETSPLEAVRRERVEGFLAEQLTLASSELTTTQARQARNFLTSVITETEIRQLYVEQVLAGRLQFGETWRAELAELGRRQLKPGESATEAILLSKGIENFSLSTLLFHLGRESLIPVLEARVSSRLGSGFQRGGFIPHSDSAWIQLKDLSEKLMILERAGLHPSE